MKKTRARVAGPLLGGDPAAVPPGPLAMNAVASGISTPMKLRVTPSRAGRGTPRAVPLRQASATLTPISESVLHSQIVQFCWAQLPTDAIFHHSPNEGKRGWNAQRWLKHSGAKAGWPDMEIFWRGRVLFLEVKMPKGTITPIQAAVHQQLTDAGFPPLVVRSFEQAERAIKEFIRP